MEDTIDEKMNVLVVDDEEVICQLMEDVLEMLDYKPMTCGEPLAAIDLFREHHNHIRFVIIDMMMPKMNGQVLFKELKKIDPAVKVLVLSGYSMIQEIEDMLEQGVVGFLQKPVTIKKLTDLISTI